MNKPVVSIITVSFNAVSTIENTILSVLSLKDEYVEYIIIDGGSSDGTIDVVKKYEDKISYWVSESDGGIYDAMNKGARIAKGKWIIYINSDDVLLSIPWEILLSYEIQKKYAGICGYVRTNDGELIAPSFNICIYLHNTLPHQGMFYNQCLKLGDYDLTYKVFADYAYNIEMYKAKQKVLCIKDVIAVHSLDGIFNNKKYVKELFSIIRKNGWFTLLLSYCYFKYKGFCLRIKHICND